VCFWINATEVLSSHENIKIDETGFYKENMGFSGTVIRDANR